MEPVKNESFKLPSLIMCGDHSSFTKADLNMKEPKPDEIDNIKEKSSTSYAKLSSTSSRTERPIDNKLRTKSEHTLRLLEARRRARSVEIVQSTEVDIAMGNRALIQAAVGSFRWPPYLLAVCMFVLLLTHVLHAIVSMLERMLPTLRKLCHYFRKWTEESWQSGSEHRVYPAALGVLTAGMYVVYCALYAVYSLAVWAVEPLASDDERQVYVDSLTDGQDK